MANAALFGRLINIVSLGTACYTCPVQRSNGTVDTVESRRSGATCCAVPVAGLAGFVPVNNSRKVKGRARISADGRAGGRRNLEAFAQTDTIATSCTNATIRAGTIASLTVSVRIKEGERGAEIDTFATEQTSTSASIAAYGARVGATVGALGAAYSADRSRSIVTCGAIRRANSFDLEGLAAVALTRHAAKAASRGALRVTRQTNFVVGVGAGWAFPDTVRLVLDTITAAVAFIAARSKTTLSTFGTTWPAYLRRIRIVKKGARSNTGAINETEGRASRTLRGQNAGATRRTGWVTT
jgi:hypothetical protein